MKTDTYCQQQNYSPLTVLFSDVLTTLILLGVLLLAVVKQGMREILYEDAKSYTVMIVGCQKFRILKIQDGRMDLHRNVTNTNATILLLGSDGKLSSRPISAIHLF